MRRVAFGILLLLLNNYAAQANCGINLEQTHGPVKTGKARVVTTLTPEDLQTGDVVGFMRLRGITSFLVHGAVGKTIDHVASVVRDVDGRVWLYDFKNPKPGEDPRGEIRKLPFDKMMAESQSSQAWVLGRAKNPLSPAEEHVVAEYFENAYLGNIEKPASCTLMVREAYALVGREVGRFATLDDLTDWFGGFAAQNWQKATVETKAVIPPYAVFEFGALGVERFHVWHEVPPGESPLVWRSPEQLWKVWTEKGDLALIADYVVAQLVERKAIPDQTQTTDERIAIFRQFIERTLKPSPPTPPQ